MLFSRNKNRWIALLVAVSFFWLASLTAMPLNAATSTDKASISKSEDDDGPGAIERKAPTYRVQRKSPLIPIIIGLVAVGAIAAVLILVVFKEKYDITGTWRMYDSLSEVQTSIVFTGDKKSGTCRFLEYNDTGIYTVSKKNVNFSYFVDPNYVWTHTGTFTDKNTMSGTVQINDYGYIETGTWNATRLSSATSEAQPQTAVKAKRVKKNK